MEDLVVKYIAKHGTRGMFDGIEKMTEKPYEWAISQFENYPNMPKKKKAKIANALQALLASYKVTRRRVEELETENGQLSLGVIATKNHYASETIWKEEKIRMQNDITRLQTSNDMLRSSVESLLSDLEEAKAACHFMIKNSPPNLHDSGTQSGLMQFNGLDLREDESCESDSESFCSLYPEYTARFPQVPVHAPTNARGRAEEPMNPAAVRGVAAEELQAAMNSIGKFDPVKRDPLDFLKKLEECGEVYRLTDADACTLLRMCLPDALSEALTQRVQDKTANKSERKQALLEVLGVVSVNRDKISEVQRRKGEHPALFAERLLKAFRTFSGNPNMTQNEISFKSAFVSKCAPLTLNAGSTPQSDFGDIMAEMTQSYNSYMKKSYHVSVVHDRKPYHSSGGRVTWKRDDYANEEREERPPPYNPESLPALYSCEKEGRNSRARKSYSRRKQSKSQLQAQVDRLSRENEELRSFMESFEA